MTITGRAISALPFPFLKVANAAPVLIPQYQDGIAQLPNNSYETYAREGYSRNELVYACVEELATSAAEPSLQVKIGQEWRHAHPVLTLLDQPNPFTDRFELLATIIMHLAIAGNAYLLKVRSASQRVVQLWLLRPDRVRIVPDSQSYISRYEYLVGNGMAIPLPVADVIHFKERNPGSLPTLNSDLYGMPPLMAAAGRVDIDNSMRNFVKAFFDNAGVPAGMLTTKQSIRPEIREEIKRRFRNEYGGPSGWHDLMILDGMEATFTAMTANIGSRGLVMPELDEIEEARIPMVFGVPQSLIGTRTSYQNGGYANKKSEEEHFWTGTLAPKYKMLAGRLRLGLKDDFTFDDLGFDLSDVRALQPDADALSARIVREVNSGLRTLEDGQRILNIRTGQTGMYYIPAQLVPTPAQVIEEAIANGEQIPPPRLTERTDNPAPDPGEPNAPKPTPAPAASRNGAQA